MCVVIRHIQSFTISGLISFEYSPNECLCSIDWCPWRHHIFTFITWKVKYIYHPFHWERKNLNQETKSLVFHIYWKYEISPVLKLRTNSWVFCIFPDQNISIKCWFVSCIIAINTMLTSIIFHSLYVRAGRLSITFYYHYHLFLKHW